MFKHLANFSYKRNKKEAIGFYIAYLVLTMLVGVLLAGTLGIFFERGASAANGFNFGFEIGSITAVIVSVGVSFLILKEKKLLGNFGYILVAILSGILALFSGGLGGLIPTAFLTTRK